MGHAARPQMLSDRPAQARAPWLGGRGRSKSRNPPLREPSMAMTEIAAALERVKKAFTRRPDIALSDDTAATARWQKGMRIVATNPNGLTVCTDMATELGGTGDQVTPGWLFRAGI